MGFDPPSNFLVFFFISLFIYDMSVFIIHIFADKDFFLLLRNVSIINLVKLIETFHNICWRRVQTSIMPLIYLKEMNL